jgi:hypothetical protein
MACVNREKYRSLKECSEISSLFLSLFNKERHSVIEKS